MDLLLASQAGDEKELKRLLSTDSPDVNYCNDCGETPLLLACKFIHTNCCSLLLDAGADVNLCDCVGNSPIHFSDSIDIVTRLLDLKADPFLKNVLGRTPLHEAAIWGNIRRFKVVLDEFTNRKYSVDVFDGEQCTPLHLAAISVDRESRMEKITLLLSAGANIDQPNAQGKTPLRLACTNFDICNTTALHMLENRANPNVLDAYGNTCVHALFQFNPYYSTDMSEDSAEMAVLKGLLRAGCTLNIRNSNGQTALHYAAHKTSSQPIPLLIQNGADPLATDNIGRTPLHKSMYNEDVEMPTIFLQYSKCLSAVDYFGRTPLHYAAAHSQIDVIEAVTEALVSSEGKLEHIINSQDNFGFRPLHYFLLYKRHEIPVLECLLRHGANVHHTLPSLDCMNMAWYSQDVQKVLMAADTGNNLNNQVLAPSNLQYELSYFLPPISIDTVKDIDPTTLRPLKDVDEYTKQINSLTIPSDIKKKAYEYMNSSIEKFVNKLCDEIKNLDQRFTFVVIPSGSSYEGTKPVTHFTQSDFDYMICFERLSEVVEVEESPSLKGYVKLSKRKSLGNDSQFDEFFSDGYLVGNKVSKKFCDLVVHVMNQPETWRGGEMECPCTPTLEFESGSPTIKLNLFWKGDFVHAHNVSLDIVPAIQVKSWWPSFARDESVLFTDNTKECHIVLKQPDVPSYSLEKFGNPTHLLRVSFSVAEREIFRKLSQMVRQCYLVIKVLSKRKIKVPLSIFYEDSSESAKMQFKSTFSSYILKIAFLFELEGIYKEDMHFDVDSFDSKRIISGTFRRLTQACETCILPSFFVPSHNIIHTFCKDGFVMSSRYIVMQLLEMSVKEAGETHDLCVKRFTERENTDFLVKRQRKTKTFLYKMGISWLN